MCISEGKYYFRLVRIISLTTNLPCRTCMYCIVICRHYLSPALIVYVSYTIYAEAENAQF